MARRHWPPSRRVALVKIDPATGQGTIVANPGYPFIFGLVCLNSQMYGFTDGGQVIIIDLVSGKATAVASFTPGFKRGHELLGTKRDSHAKAQGRKEDSVPPHRSPVAALQHPYGCCRSV
jgi:hypothetical protein